MKMAKRFLLSSARLSKSLLSTRSSSPLDIQVTHFSHRSYPFLSNSNVCRNYGFLSSHHQRFYSSSSPIALDSIADLIITTNVWSVELEKQLEEFQPALTYETVMYVLKSLEKTPKKALAFFKWVYDKHDDGVKPNSLVYNLMLRILGKKETLDEFKEFFKRLEEEDCCVDNNTHLIVMRYLTTEPRKIIKVAKAWNDVYEKINKKHVTDDIVGVILESTSMDDMKQKLEKVEVTLSETFVLRTLWSWPMRRNPVKALWFFRWLKDDMGYTHNVVTYNAILGVLCEAESIDEFWSMVEELKSKGYDMDIDTYDRVSNKLVRTKMVKDAAKLYDLMMDGPYNPLVQDCSPSLRNMALSVKKYEATENSLSKEAYNQIYKSLIMLHKFDEAEKVLKAMRVAGFEPDDFTYAKTWNTSIQAHCKEGEIDQALKCLATILETNSKVGNRAFQDLVVCLCNKGRVDDAYNMVTEVVDKHNVRPFLLTFQKLIQELLREKKLEEAISLLSLMIKHDYPPCRGLCVDYISKFGTVNDAMKLLKGLSIKENASLNSYKSVFKSFLKEGRESEARELFDKSPEYIRKQKSIMHHFNKGKEPQHLIHKQESTV